MSISELKNNFHSLIEEINDIELLENYFEGLSISANKGLENELSEEGKNEILQAYAESEIETNLIDNDEVMEKISKWLQK
ncbi:MAG: hypothetical protein IPL53_01950 [Ignavibacteria bacterium]|nr:hypothetical protein [Ignavibacteria bacterium]